MNANKETVKKCAIAGIVITAIVIFIFAMSVSDAKKFGEKDICTSATAITATTANTAFKSKSINKSYTVYLLDSGSEYSYGKDKNTFYIVQPIGNEIIAYKVTYTSSNKTTLRANILNYFNTVKEESLPTGLVAGGLFTASIVVPLLLGLATIGLWIWWYFLNKQEELARANKKLATTPIINSTQASPPLYIPKTNTASKYSNEYEDEVNNPQDEEDDDSGEVVIARKNKKRE